MEQKLIEIARRYIEMETGPETEILNIQLFNLAAQVSNPRTKAGRAIVAYVQAEERTDFSMAANDEWCKMCRALGCAA